MIKQRTMLKIANEDFLYGVAAWCLLA